MREAGQRRPLGPEERHVEEDARRLVGVIVRRLRLLLRLLWRRLLLDGRLDRLGRPQREKVLEARAVIVVAGRRAAGGVHRARGRAP
eukprot:6202833-Prymnesium_polylepis.2